MTLLVISLAIFAIVLICAIIIHCFHRERQLRRDQEALMRRKPLRQSPPSQVQPRGR